MAEITFQNVWKRYPDGFEAAFRRLGAGSRARFRAARKVGLRQCSRSG